MQLQSKIIIPVLGNQTADGIENRFLICGGLFLCIYKKKKNEIRKFNLKKKKEKEENSRGETWRPECGAEHGKDRRSRGNEQPICWLIRSVDREAALPESRTSLSRKSAPSISSQNTKLSSELEGKDSGTLNFEYIYIEREREAKPGGSKRWWQRCKHRRRCSPHTPIYPLSLPPPLASSPFCQGARK